MKNQKIAAMITAATLVLATAAFAQSSNLQTFDVKGKVSTPMTTFTTQGFSSTNAAQSATLDVYISSWKLGVIGFDINGANLKIASVKAAKGITVSLKDASGGATQDRLQFTVKADANTPKGLYAVQVMLENKKFGDQGMITIMAEVK
jgi:hypothetical protein